MSTPEGKVKADINKMLRKFPADKVWVTRPVPYGYGESSLDMLGCVKTSQGALFFAVEVKAPGKKPTDREALLIERLKALNAAVFVIDGTEKTDTIRALEAWILLVLD